MFAGAPRSARSTARSSSLPIASASTRRRIGYSLGSSELRNASLKKRSNDEGSIDTPREHGCDRRKLAIRAVYHSHPDHDAYFSATDRAQACSFDPPEPDYPGIVYIVMSIRAGKFARAAAFGWNFETKEFAETKLTVE